MIVEKYQSDGRKILNTKVQHEVIVYNTYAFPLCIICADESKSEWIYEHFSQIMFSRSEDGYAGIDFLEDTNYADVMVRQVTAFEQMKNAEDIVTFLKQKINEEWQPILVVDFDCLKEKRVPPYPHFLIQIYLYGYDDLNKEFHGIGFKADHSFDEIRFGYEEVREAFTSMLRYNKHDIDWVDRYTLTCLKLKNPGEKYVCSREIIRQGLYDFCYSVDGKDRIRIEDRTETRLATATFGLKAQESVIEALHELLEGKFVIDFRSIHLLKEQKDLTYKKLQYLLQDDACSFPMGNIKSKEEAVQLLNKYKSICRKLGKARLMYMMQVEIDSRNLYGQLENRDVIQKVITVLEEVTQSEKEILMSFL